MTTQNPTDLARETLKQLASRQLLPTPHNFSRIYAEVSGDETSGKHRLAELMTQAFTSLTPQNHSYRLGLARLNKALDDEAWEQVPQQCIDLITLHLRERELADSWGNLILSLLRQWEIRHPDLSQNYKQSALERLVINFGNQPEALNEKLHKLLQDWSRGQCEAPPAEEPAATREQPDMATADGHAGLSNALMLTLKYGVEPRLVHYPDLLQSYEPLLQQLSELDDSAAARLAFSAQLRAFLIKLELQSQQDERLVTGLSNLLRLLLQNIAELHGSDSYLVGQIACLQDMLSAPLQSVQQIYPLEAKLKEVIHQQGLLKSSLDEAANSLRALLGSFLSQLSQMSNETEVFQGRIASYSGKLQHAASLTEVRHIADELSQDTDTMQHTLQHSRAALLAAQGEVENAQQRIADLEQALESASSKVKEDPLTGAYNRRGLDEHFARELSRAERTGSPLSVALLDVDNFKQLNDKYGHLAGDHALRFLVDAIRQLLRPSDICARFGGEEFIILLADTPHDEAVQTIQRLQRELTRSFFLTNNERLIITFSAGVALWHLGERDCDVIDRADRAMYQAKLNGKNRTVSAENSAEPAAVLA